MANQFTVCSTRTAARMQDIVEELFEKDRYIVFTWRFGDMATIKQKALIHIWFRTWMARVLHKPEDDVTEDEIAGIKRTIKARFYHETGHEWMVNKVREAFPPYREVTDYTSIAEWSTANTFEVMTWMQATAAQAGIVLESKGEHTDLKRQQHV